jgi:hypothetical protein
MRAKACSHHHPPISLTSSKQLQRATTKFNESDSVVEASEYQDAPVYQEVKKFKLSACPPGSTNSDSDVPLKQNSAYGHVHELKAAASQGDKMNENSDCVIFNPIYS